MHFFDKLFRLQSVKITSDSVFGMYFLIILVGKLISIKLDYEMWHRKVVLKERARKKSFTGLLTFSTIMINVSNA